jgi:hypothetical protein
MGKNKIILRILAFLILFIPSYLAVYTIYNISSDELTPENVTMVTVTSADGQVFEYDRPNEIRMFIKAVRDAVSITSRNVEGAPKTLTFFKAERPIEFELYLSLNHELCVIRDSNGNFFHITPDNARALLSEPISDPLFEFNYVPIAGVPQGDDRVQGVYPAEGVWKLRKLDGEFHDTSVESRFAETNEIKISQNYPFAIHFAVEPDIINIAVFDNKELTPMGGLLEQLDIPNYESRKELQFVLTVEWHEHEEHDFYGSAVYNIDVIYEVPAGFSISNHEANAGDLIIITASNVGARDTLTLSIPELDFKADFIQFGESKIGLVPIGLDFTGILTINIEGDYPAEYQVMLNTGTPALINYSAAEENITPHLSDNAKHTRQTHYNEIFAGDSNPQKLWEDDFVNPSGQGNVLLGFGTTITINMGNAHPNTGLRLGMNIGGTVVASNAGRVVFAEQIPYHGNLIVIDHGAGVRTWYGRLDRIDVQVGDTVEAGQEIATFGRTGMPTTLGANLYFAASVHNVFINPNVLLEDGIHPAENSRILGNLADILDSDGNAENGESELPEAAQE